MENFDFCDTTSLICSFQWFDAVDRGSEGHLVCKLPAALSPKVLF